MHRGEQADAVKLQVAESASQAAPDVPLGRVEHEEPDKSRGMPAHRGGDRLLVVRETRNERDPRDAVSIELRGPAIRKLVGSAGIVPPKAVRYCSDAIGVGKLGKPPGEQLEKPRREEMAMNVAQPHDQEAIIIGLVSDTHGLLRDGVLAALAGVSEILHAETSAAAKFLTGSRDRAGSGRHVNVPSAGSPRCTAARHAVGRIFT